MLFDNSNLYSPCHGNHKNGRHGHRRLSSWLLSSDSALQSIGSNFGWRKSKITSPTIPVRSTLQTNSRCSLGGNRCVRGNRTLGIGRSAGQSLLLRSEIYGFFKCLIVFGGFTESALLKIAARCSGWSRAWRASQVSARLTRSDRPGRQGITDLRLSANTEILEPADHAAFARV